MTKIQNYTRINTKTHSNFFSSNQKTGGVLENVTEYTTFDPLLSDENYLDLHLNNIALENMCKKIDTNTIQQSQDPNAENKGKITKTILFRVVTQNYQNLV